jgi:hypothetical protein
MIPIPLFPVRGAIVPTWLGWLVLEIGGHDTYSPSGKGAAGVPSGALRRKCRNLNEGFSPRGMSSAITSSKFDFVSSLSHPRDEDGFSLIPIP